MRRKWRTEGKLRNDAKKKNAPVVCLPVTSVREVSKPLAKVNMPANYHTTSADKESEEII